MSVYIDGAVRSEGQTIAVIMSPDQLKDYLNYKNMEAIFKSNQPMRELFFRYCKHDDDCLSKRPNDSKLDECPCGLSQAIAKVGWR